MSDLQKAAQQALYALELDAYGEPSRYERTEAIAALRAALAESVQEPVAWAYVNSDGECEQIEYDTPPDHPSITPLYAAPPQRKPLTVAETNALIDSVDGLGIGRNVMHKVARAIERAHGIGNKDE